MPTSSLASRFRALTIGDARTFAGLLALPRGMEDPDHCRSACLMRIAVLVVLDADTPAYQREVNDALGAGVTPEEIHDVLGAVASLVGTSRVMSAAPRIALALGFDMDEAIESMDPEMRLR